MLNSYTYNDVYKSEIRMSLFRNPMKGDGNWVTAEKPIDPQNKPEKYIPKILEEIKYGFYADGFFDRRPIVERDMIDGIERGSGKVSKYKGVSLDTTEAAYGGVLIFNPDNNASIFFPAAGRRWHTMVVWNMRVRQGIIGLLQRLRGGLIRQVEKRKVLLTVIFGG